jgi:hypothetical protein
VNNYRHYIVAQNRPSGVATHAGSTVSVPGMGVPLRFGMRVLAAFGHRRLNQIADSVLTAARK